MAPVKFCSDPLKKHSKKIFKGIRKVNKKPSLQCLELLKEDTLVCSNCYRVISKDPSVLTHTSAESDLPKGSTEGISSATSPSTENISCSSETSSNDPEINIKSKKLLQENILPCLDESPIKTAGMTHQQKVKWAMFKATDKLKRSIEAAYAVTLQEAGPSTSFEDDQNSSKLNKYEFLMMELKDKFITTRSKKVKLQILTLSPFTINETEAFFGASN